MLVHLHPTVCEVVSRSALPLILMKHLCLSQRKERLKDAEDNELERQGRQAFALEDAAYQPASKSQAGYTGS